MNNYRFLDMRVDKLGKKNMTQGELAKELNIERNRIQQLETSPKVIPKEEELRAYCEYFNTTSDYLLGIRETKPVDENIAMIGKVTGLTDTSIQLLKTDLNKDEKRILNVLIESGSIALIRMALEYDFNSLYSSIQIKGVGARELSNEESRKLFTHIRNELFIEILSSLSKDKEIVNLFMRKASISNIENIKSVVDFANKSYEDLGDDRKDFKDKVEQFFQKEVERIENTDFYFEITHDK